MARIKVDFTGVESFSNCDEGEHIARLVSIEEKTASTGMEMLTGVFEVIRGSSKGAKVFENFPLSQKGLWKLKSFLEVIGIKAEAKIALDLDKLVGKTCIIAVVHQEYNGVVRSRISEYKKLEGKSKPAADNDYDDEGAVEDEYEEPVPAPKKSKKAAKKAPPKPEPDDDDDDDDWEEA